MHSLCLFLLINTEKIKLMITWFLFGILGWLLIIQAYNRLEGNNPKRKWHQLPVILAGPLSIIMGLLFLWDATLDPPPEYKPDPNLLRDAIEDAKAVREIAKLSVKE